MLGPPAITVYPNVSMSKSVKQLLAVKTLSLNGLSNSEMIIKALCCGVMLNIFQHHDVCRTEWNRIMHAVNGNIVSVVVFKFFLYYLLTYDRFFNNIDNQLDIITSDINNFNYISIETVSLDSPNMVDIGQLLVNSTHRALWVQLPMSVGAYTAYQLLAPTMNYINPRTFSVPGYIHAVDYELISHAFRLVKFDPRINSNMVALLRNNNFDWQYITRMFPGWASSLSNLLVFRKDFVPPKSASFRTVQFITKSSVSTISVWGLYAMRTMSVRTFAQIMEKLGRISSYGREYMRMKKNDDYIPMDSLDDGQNDVSTVVMDRAELVRMAKQTKVSKQYFQTDQYVMDLLLGTMGSVGGEPKHSSIMPSLQSLVPDQSLQQSVTTMEAQEVMQQEANVVVHVGAPHIDEETQHLLVQSMLRSFPEQLKVVDSSGVSDKEKEDKNIRETRSHRPKRQTKPQSSIPPSGQRQLPKGVEIHCPNGMCAQSFCYYYKIRAERSDSDCSFSDGALHWMARRYLHHILPDAVRRMLKETGQSEYVIRLIDLYKKVNSGTATIAEIKEMLSPQCKLNGLKKDLMQRTFPEPSRVEMDVPKGAKVKLEVVTNQVGSLYDTTERGLHLSHHLWSDNNDYDRDCPLLPQYATCHNDTFSSRIKRQIPMSVVRG